MKTKKIIITFLLFIIAITTISCGKASADESSGKSADKSSDDMYVYDQAGADFSGLDYNLYNYVVKNNLIYFIAEEYKDDYSKNHIYVADFDDMKANEIECELKENEAIYWIAAGYNGDFYYISDIDGKETLHSINASMDNTSSSGDASMNKSTPLDEIIGEDDELIDIAANKKGEIYLFCKAKFYKLDKELSAIDSQSYNSEYDLYDIAIDKNGNILGAFANQVMEVKTYVMKLSDEKSSWSELFSINDLHEDILVDSMEGDEYDVYLRAHDGMYGYKEDSEDPFKIVDFGNSCISEEEGHMVSAISNGRFIGLSYETGMYYIEKQTGIEDSRKEIIMAFSDPKVVNEAVKFNRTNSEYRIVIRDYDGYEDSEKQLSIDIAAGNAPDILPFSKDLYEGGYLADLSEYYASSGIEEELIESVDKYMKIDGSIYQVSPFYIATGYIMKQEDYEKISSYDAGEIIDYLNEEQLALITNEDSIEILALLSNVGNSFIDFKNKKCNFKSDEFKKILEYSKENGQEAGDDLNYEERQQEIVKAFRDGKSLLLPDYDICPEFIQDYRQLYGDDIVLTNGIGQIGGMSAIRYPINLCIYEGSEHKDVAWEFLEILMQEEFQAKNCTYYNPVRKDAMEHRYQILKATEAYTDEYGVDVEPISVEGEYYGYSMVRKPLIDEDIKIFEEYINGINGDTIEGYDMQVAEILLEETSDYYSGRAKLDKCVDRIQNRVNTYLNE
ncbi:MAG: extracellular solute-binding protein [Eubacterium sp.]|nr:extracellular solute-binding protein [Eubacterium sp.]